MAKPADAMALEVAARTPLPGETVLIDLARPDGGALPPFTAGAHIDVGVADDIIRQYSLCNDPAERHRYRIAVLRDPQSRGGSARIHDAFLPGRQVLVGPPRNLFPLAEGARRHILIGGGIGFTPIAAMAATLQAEGRSFALHYCCRSRAEAPFADVVQDFAGTSHYSREGDTTRFDPAAALGPPDPDTHVYVCGPTGFMDAVGEAAIGLGWSPTNIHREAFVAAEPAAQPGDRPFEVRIASTGATVTVPADAPVTTALAAAGVDLAVSCEQGICGTCVVSVLEGTPDHRDSYLTDEEHDRNTLFTPCCSRALSPLLVLDL
ncbi:MAG: PDR/VanB family oxidoreductase [Sphingomonas fennica]